MKYDVANKVNNGTVEKKKMMKLKMMKMKMKKNPKYSRRRKRNTTLKTSNRVRRRRTKK